MQSKETGRSTLNCRGILRIPSTWRRSGGFGLIGWIIAIPLVLVALVIIVIGFYEGRKAYWDSEVREMCAKDGHVRIFEQVTITKRELDRMLQTGNGVISLMMKNSTKTKGPVYLESKETNIREANPRVRRTEWSAVRRADQKVVAQWHSFGRVGGDIPSPAHESSFRCPDWQQTWIELRDLFLVKGD